jgi:hypothetical protein
MLFLNCFHGSSAANRLLYDSVNMDVIVCQYDTMDFPVFCSCLLVCMIIRPTHCTWQNAIRRGKSTKRAPNKET